MFDPSSTPTNSFSPLTLSRFTEIFLVPFIVCHLIAQDLGCSTKEAHKVMIESGDVGERLQPQKDDDKELDDILMNNGRKARNERKALDAPKVSRGLQIWELELYVFCRPRNYVPKAHTS
jgi:hypothetical protein